MGTVLQPAGPPLPAPYAAAPEADALRPTAATRRLAGSQVQALLTASPAFHELGPRRRRRLSSELVKVASYLAELIRDDWYQSSRLGQRPVLRRREHVPAPAAAASVATAQSAADEFRPTSANQVARVTRETLRAIAFPTFVADLIKGTFQAIIDASIREMEAYVELLSNVGKTVDQFMADNISDNQARDWLAQRYPEHIVIRGGRAVARSGASDRLPAFRRDLGLSEDVSDLDEDTINEILVPAARRKLAQNRLQILSSLVLMGFQRIVVTGGKIRATMGFHIDTTDRAHAEQATDFDLRHSAALQFGFGPWSASASHSISYVRSTRADSDAELNVNADLTGEVDIRFKSDYFPLERFADGNAVRRIQGNTAVPSANAPSSVPDSGNVTPTPPRRHARRQPRLRAIGTPPPAPRQPVAPTAPTPVQRPPAQRSGQTTPTQRSDQTTAPTTTQEDAA